LVNFFKVYDHVIDGLAFVSGAIIAGIFLAIVYDVSIRTVGLRTPLWTVALAEYGLLYATLLGSPWVLRRKSHVFITILTSRLSGSAKLVVERFGYVSGTAVCILLAYISLTVAVNEFDRGIVDIRTFRTPFWIVTAPMPLSFSLLAIQFLRFLFGNDSMLENERQGKEGL
tara:strand:+ start:775 stop:1287 length:513 start_codon:yes stop_codon:yes gene_type:complete